MGKFSTGETVVFITTAIFSILTAIFVGITGSYKCKDLNCSGDPCRINTHDLYYAVSIDFTNSGSLHCPYKDGVLAMGSIATLLIPISAIIQCIYRRRNKKVIAIFCCVAAIFALMGGALMAANVNSPSEG